MTASYQILRGIGFGVLIWLNIQIIKEYSEKLNKNKRDKTKNKRYKKNKIKKYRKVLDKNGNMDYNNVNNKQREKTKRKSTKELKKLHVGGQSNGMNS